MPTKERRGRSQRRASKTGQARVDLQRHYNRRIASLVLDQEFRITVIRSGYPTIVVDPMATDVQWNDEGPVLTGNITLQKPHVQDRKVQLRDGHVVRLQVMWGDTWRELWRMRIYDPDASLDGTLSFPLFDDLKLLDASRDDWEFRRGKQHKKGWLAHEVAVEVARRYKIPLGRIARGTKRIKSLKKDDASPLDVMIAAYKAEREKSGRRFVFRWGIHEGRYCLNILPLRRNPILHSLREQIMSGNLTSVRREDFATSITVRGKGKDDEKVVHRETRESAVKQYGLVHRQVKLDGLDTHREAVRRSRRILARRMKPKRTLTISHQGIAMVRRGDAVRVSLPDWGYKGQAGILFVRAVRHQLQSGNYTMDLDLGVNDPYVDPAEIRKLKNKERRRKKRKS